MCATCGCSGEVHLHDHDHDHGHDHDHAHEHGHGHEHHHHGHDPDPPIPPGRTLLEIEEDLLARNAEVAERIREGLAARGTLALNLVSAPGSGKTSLLERTVRDLGREFPVSVIEGDQATTRDADRIRAAGARAIQIQTGTGCHLDAAMVEPALRELDPGPGSVVCIENVGNLVCPALFDLGEAAKVVLLSVTEGDDKPEKYPHMFRAASLMVIHKVDLLPYVEFDLAAAVRRARRVNPTIEVLEVSATRGQGLPTWYAWIRGRLAVARARAGL